MQANLVGPYKADADTLFLLHLDEVAGSSVTTNVGLKGGNFISVNYASGGTAPPVVTTMLGGTSFASGSLNFANCVANTTAGYLLGYDFSGDGTFTGDGGGGTLGADALAMTNLNIGLGGQSPFTLEALISPSTTSGNQEIICTDSSASQRGFQFRISSGSLMFQFIYGSQALTATIPTSGANAFVANGWYHVAFTYNGAVGTLYWTKLDPSAGAANVIGSGALTLGAADGTVTGTLCLGNRGRPNGTETFLGSIDEVRISSVCRAANQMQFYSPLVTITQNPISQNVDYNEPVSFTLGATTTGSTLGYQWWFNSNGIAGATNATFAISNVAAANGGYYSCLVTNTAGNAATSSPALLVVGAANFLNHRYNFNTNADDLIGTADGTLFGDAVVTNGSLVLDGTSGTYMQLPADVVNGADQQALTMEFWATFGVNSDNCCVFSFGDTNIILDTVNGSQYAIYSPHNSSGQGLYITPSDSGFAQSVTASGNLDGLTLHVACVIDPPNQTMAIYTNGILEAINTNLTIGLANVNDVFSYIGGSLFPADPTLNASIDELRIYNGALSSLSLKQSDDQGPNIVLATGPATFAIQPASTSVPVGQSATFTAAAVGYLPITYQWYKNGALVPAATNASYSFVAALADNNASIVCYATNTIGVTTYVTNSATVALSVFLPPTLAWLGSADGGANNTWDTTSLDWTNNLAGGGVLAFAQTNGVVFDDRAGGGSVDLEQSIIPYNITVNASASYTLTSSGSEGLLSGQGSILKQNSGTLTIDLTNVMSGPTTISGGKLQIGNNDTFGTLGSGPVTNNGTLSLDRADTVLTLANAIHGTGTLSVDGNGAVTISGNSDFSGTTLLNDGIAYLTSRTGLGSPASGTIVASGAQLYLTVGLDLAEPLSLAGSGDGNGALRVGGAAASVETGAIFLTTDSTIDVDGSATLTLSNVVSGAAALTASGSGTLALNATNTFTGGFVLDGPVANVNANGALGPGTVSITGSGYFLIGDGLDVPNFFLASSVSPGTALGLLMVNDNTNGTVTTLSGPLEFDVSPASGGNFAGPTSSGYLNVTGPITNNGSGTISSRLGFVRFSGGGSYTTFDLDQGTVSLGANNGLCPAATLAVAGSGAATFDLNGFDQTLEGLTNGATYAELVTNSAATTSVLTLNLAVADTYSGDIGGALALVDNGPASLYLAGTNTYTGNTTVKAGTLELAQPSFAAQSTVTLAAGALLQLDFAATNVVSALVLNGVSQSLGIYNSTTKPSYFSGSGSLQVVTAVPLSPTNLTASVSGNTLNLSWPANYLGWRLLEQTNHLAQGLSNNTNDWGTVSGSTSTNIIRVGVDPAKPAEFYRLVYP